MEKGYIRVLDKLGRTIETTQEWQITPDAFDYIIFKDGNVIKAKNGKTGNIDYTSNKASDVIQYALDNGRNIFIDRGTYTLDTGVRFYSGTRIVGAGHGLTVLKGDNLNQAILEPYDTSTRLYRVVIEGLKIDNQSRDNAGSIGINFTKVSLGIIKGVEIVGVETGILFKGSAYYNDVYSVYIVSTYNGIVFDTDGTSGANENHVYGGRVDTADIGIDDRSGNGILISGTSIENALQYGIRFNSTGSLAVNPRLESCTTGILFDTNSLRNMAINPYFSNTTTRYIDDGNGNAILSALDNIYVINNDINYSTSIFKRTGGGGDGTNPAFYISDEYTNSGTPTTLKVETKRWGGKIASFITSAGYETYIDSTNGELYVGRPGYGIVLTSPNGTKFRITVDDTGNLVITQI